MGDRRHAREAGQAVRRAEGRHVTPGGCQELRAEQDTQTGQAADHLGGRMAAKPALDELVNLLDLLVKGQHPSARSAIKRAATCSPGSLIVWALAAPTAAPASLSTPRTLRERVAGPRLDGEVPLVRAALTMYVVPAPWAFITLWALSPAPITTPPLIPHLATGGGEVGAGSVVGAGMVLLVAATVVGGAVVVGGTVVGGPDGSPGPPKKGSRTKQMNPAWTDRRVSGRQSQRPLWSK
jgi:hypothetical protein